jgi:glycosyltransferase involved in cell wall biosynthesis
VPDVVGDAVSGLLAPSGDAEALARAVMSLVRDPQRRERMGAEARSAAYPRYDVSRLLADVGALYESLVQT